MSLLQEVFNERPIWAREALALRVSQSPHMATLKKALQYVSYRFTAGPWRDCLIKRGVDPRRDPVYRAYQTIYFRVHNEEKAEKKWYQPSRYTGSQNHAISPIQTFDGKSFTPGNRTWQVCDISDPLLERLIKTAPVRQSCDNACDGWFTNGALAKIRSIMRTKLDVIQLGKEVTDEEFAVTLEFPDAVAGKRDHRDIVVPLPDVYPSNEEITKMSQKGIHLIRTGARKATLGKGPLRSRNRTALRHAITTYEDTDEDDPMEYPRFSRFTSGEDENNGDPIQGTGIPATSFGEAYIGQTQQDDDGSENKLLYGENEQMMPGSFDGAEDAPSDSERSELGSDEYGDSELDTPSRTY
ncbi:putative Transcription factor tau subunit sfc1 [Glarea lozoyensis 74030]|nr:putative Transcription factor tau subunit sfc1 [Glarea lozoyensis 74030]